MRRAALAAIFALAALAASLAAGTEQAPAKHDEGAGPGRGPLCYMKPHPHKATLPGVGSLDGCEPSGSLVPAVARNLVGDVGTASAAIRVCAGTNYDASTREAIRLLNSGTAGGFGRALFAWAGGLSNCSHELTSGRVSSIAVTGNYLSGGRHPADCGGGWGCAVHYTVRGDPHYGYVGQAEVRMHPDLDVVTAVSGLTGACAPDGHEDRPDYNPATATLRICTNTADVQAGRADGTLELTRHIAHELMHVAGLGDYYCGAAPLGATRALMDSRFLSDCRSPLLATDAARTAGTAELATAWDRGDYTALYSPAAVTGLTASASGSRLRLSWTAAHVHVERGFAVERWTGSAWQRVTGALAPANATGISIAQPSAATRYRVISVTDAFGTAAPRTSAISGTVTYTPAAPARTVTKTATATSTANQGDANTKAEKAAREALVAAHPGVTGIRVTHAELAESTDTKTGKATGSGTGATEAAARSAALDSARAAARAAGGTGATVTARVTGTTPPETGTARGSGSSEASQAAANADARDNARKAIPRGATITGSPTASSAARGSRTETKTGTVSRAGVGSTDKQAVSTALLNARTAALAAGGTGATVTGTSVGTTRANWRSGTTSISASYTADTETAAWLGCAGKLVSAARAVSGYVSHSAACSVSAGVGAEGETIYTGSGTATVTWRRITGWTATATASWSRTVTITIYNATATASWTRGAWSASAEANWSRTVTVGAWSASAEANWSRTVTVGAWSASAEANWSRTVTTYKARGTATGTVAAPP